MRLSQRTILVVTLVAYLAIVANSQLTEAENTQTSSPDVVVETSSTGSAVESASLDVLNTDLSLMTSPIMSAYTSASIYPSPTSYDASSTVLPTTSLPQPTLTMDEVSVHQGGGDAVLLCHIDRDYTFSSVHFLKNNALLGQSPDISEDRTEFTYRISDPRCTDSGEYECRVVGEEGNLTTAANLTVLVNSGKPTLTLPSEIVEGRWKETSLFVCSYRQGIPPAEVYWSATLANGTTLDRLNFITQESVAENQTDSCALEATSQFYYAFSMAWNASSVCCNVKEGANATTACGDVYVIPSDTCMNQIGNFEHPYTCQLWIVCVSDVVYIGRCQKGHCIDLQNDVCVSGPRDGPTVDGGLTQWAQWSGLTCTRTCGLSETGTVVRTRSCANPAPQNGGNNCTGSTFETQNRNCGFSACPINGGLTQWTQWNVPNCPRTCGSTATLTVTRTRSCTNPVPQFGGRGCTSLGYVFGTKSGTVDCRAVQQYHDRGHHNGAYHIWEIKTGPSA